MLPQVWRLRGFLTGGLWLGGFCPELFAEDFDWTPMAPYLMTLLLQKKIVTLTNFAGLTTLMKCFCYNVFRYCTVLIFLLRRWKKAHLEDVGSWIARCCRVQNVSWPRRTSCADVGQWSFLTSWGKFWEKSVTEERIIPGTIYHQRFLQLLTELISYMTPLMRDSTEKFIFA